MVLMLWLLWWCIILMKISNVSLCHCLISVMYALNLKMSEMCPPSLCVRVILDPQNVSIKLDVTDPPLPPRHLCWQLFQSPKWEWEFSYRCRQFVLIIPILSVGSDESINSYCINKAPWKWSFTFFLIVFSRAYQQRDNTDNCQVNRQLVFSLIFGRKSLLLIAIGLSAVWCIQPVWTLRACIWSQKCFPFVFWSCLFISVCFGCLPRVVKVEFLQHSHPEHDSHR